MLSPALALAIVSCAISPLDESKHFEGRRISKVTIAYQGPKTVDEERLRQLMSMKKGTIYTHHAADGDIKSLYESGLVDDVSIRVTPDHSQLRVKTVVTTRPALGAGPHVPITGNTAFSDQKLISEGFKGMTLGRSFIRTRVETAARGMEAYYRQMGFEEATVTLDLKRSKMWPFHAPEDQVYYLTVKEGPRTAVSPPAETPPSQTNP